MTSRWWFQRGGGSCCSSSDESGTDAGTRRRQAGLRERHSACGPRTADRTSSDRATDHSAGHRAASCLVPDFQIRRERKQSTEAPIPLTPPIQGSYIMSDTYRDVEYHDTTNTLGQFSFWISLSLRPKTETKRFNFGLSPELRLTNHRSASSLTSSATRR